MSTKTDILLSNMRKCIEKYEMIKDNDRVLCAVSGGKDSLALAYGLKRLSAFLPVSFTVSAVTVDMGLGADFSPVAGFMKNENIPYEIIKTDIGKAIEGLEKPCSLCARLRRAALCNYAAEKGFDKLALGHTEDDTAETALMNLLYGGRLYTLEPTTGYEDKSLTLIRPLMTTNERLVRSLVSELSLPVIKNPCGRESDSARDEIRKIIKETDKTCRGTAHRIAKAYFNED
ncbi:MAG: tRNA 2-thiocytidine biosynthesis protein TtcA [Clostridia bacterium]|nr:tRNA 2-thiocytidine biosynthesis protein TtcA [Clostridia bacterium]